MQRPNEKFKFKIEGVKLSGELFAIQLNNPERPGDLLGSLCHMMAENKINIAFLCMASTKGEGLMTCCVEAQDQDRATKLIASRWDMAGRTRFLPRVGLLSLFPHRSSYRLLGLSLSAFHGALIPVHGLASSLSMLTFVTEYDSLEKAVEALIRVLDLPSDHVPLRPQIRVTQTDIIKGNES